MISKREFRRQRREDWARFTELIRKVDNSSRRKFTAEESSEFSRLFRMVCNDLSIVRSRDWGTGLALYLNDLVTKGHNIFYKSPPSRLHQFLRFVGSEFPRTFRRNFLYFCVAAALFFVPMMITWGVVQRRPELAARILPAAMLDQAEEQYKQAEFKKFGAERAVMGGFYVRNNVGIALRCFAMGILLGTGTVYVLLMNGIVIGAVVGYVVGMGHDEQILSFIVSHGSFELTAIAVAGGGGLILGDAIVHPGARSRIDSLRTRGVEAVQIACGAAVMLMVAAMIEAFWSPAPIPSEYKYAAGGLLWILVILYLSLAGRGGETA